MTSGVTRAPAGEGPEPPRPPQIRNLDGTRRALGPIEFDVATREIVFPAKVNMTRGVIEYILVHDLGKVHESLLSTAVTPFDLNVVLLLLNYQSDPGWHVPPAKPKPLESVKPATLCDIFVRWTDPQGGEKSARVESWVWNRRTRSTAIEGPWVYTGSTATVDGRFAAQVDGTHVALYLDPRCVFNNPRPGNDDDQLWEPAKTAPPKGTPVIVSFRPHATQPAGESKPKPAGKSGTSPTPPSNGKPTKTGK